VVVGCLLAKGEVATTGGFLAAGGVPEIGEAAVGNLEGAAGIMVGNLEGAAAVIVVQGLLEVGEVAAGGLFVLLAGVAATTGCCLATDGEVAIGNLEGVDGFVVGNFDGAAAVTVVTGLLEVGEVAATTGCCLATDGEVAIGHLEGSDGFVVGNFDGAAAVIVVTGLLEVGEVAATTGCCLATDGEVSIGNLEGAAACDCASIEARG
jgi:hypothetical protein